MMKRLPRWLLALIFIVIAAVAGLSAVGGVREGYDTIKGALEDLGLPTTVLYIVLVVAGLIILVLAWLLTQPVRDDGTIRRFDKDIGEQFPPSLLLDDFSLAWGMGEIPQPSALLVGRDEMQAVIHIDLDAGHNVTLHGAGGMGKTVLAVTVAVTRENNGEKVFWVQAIDRHASLAALCDQVGQCLGNREIARVPIEAKPGYVRSLLHQHAIALLVIDDLWEGETARAFEHQALPAGCQLMLTGRNRVAIGRAQHVEKLAPNDSAVLYRYHAQLASNEDVSPVCERMDGHPMALELAGRMTYLEALSIEELCARLDGAHGRVRVLRLDEGRDNLWNVMLASYEVFFTNEQAVFRAIGALWSTTVAAELLAPVAELNADATELALKGLVHRSLAIKEKTRDGRPCYRIHNLLYDFACALLRENGTLGDAQQRALIECVTYARHHATRRRIDHDFLEVEKENLLEAASWAAEQGQWEAVNQLAFDLYGKSRFLDLRGYARESILLLELGMKASRALNDTRGEVNHLGNLGLACAAQGWMEEAIAYLERALAISQAIGDRCGESNHLGSLGLAYAAQRRMEEAIAYLERALAISQAIGDRCGEGNHLGNLGEVYGELDELGHAEVLTHQALTIHRETGSQRGVGTWLHNLGWIAQAYAEQATDDEAVALLRQAKALYEESLSIRRKIKDPRAKITASALKFVLAKLRGAQSTGQNKMRP